MELENGAGRRSKHGRRKLARTSSVFLAVAAAEGVLVGALDLTGRPNLATRMADLSVPYYLTTERALQPAPKAVERRPLKKRKPQTTSPAASPPPSSEPNVSAPAPTTPPSAGAAPPAPDYGRWTVAPGAWPEAGHGRIVVSVCDPANLESLPPEARKACVETLKTAAAGPPARRGAAQDWTNHSPISCEPKDEPAHKWLFDHCHGLRLKYRF